MELLKKIFPPIFLFAVFGYVIFQVPYPKSLTDASFIQIASFFIPLFLALTSMFNIFFLSYPISSSVSLGIIFLLILIALDSFNFVTGLLLIVSMGLIVSYFKKIMRKNLTKLPKIPKLTRLKKQ